MRHSPTVFASLFTLLILLFCTGIALTGATLFINIRRVAPVGDFGTQSSLALDSKGNPHISYTYANETGTWLMYANWTDSKFNLQTVNANGGNYPSLDMDSNDNPHISFIYENATGTFLMYTSRINSEWETQTIDFVQNGSDDSAPSLKLDNRGFPHIAYVGTDQNIEYATWDDSAWHIETLDPVTAQVADPSLALDFEGKPSISYFDPTVGLKCALWTGSTWNVMVADADQNAGKESSIAVDSWGKPHISYDDDANGNLKYASWTGSKWNIQIVDRNKHISLHSSLALDSDGTPHISYEDNAVGNLMYANWNVSAWNLRIIDSIRLAPGDLGLWGFPTSLALDETGTAHISYTGYTRTELKYASISDLPSVLITFDQSGLEGYGGKVLEVDSVDYDAGDLPKLFVWQEGTNHSFTFEPTIILNPEGKLDWVSTSGLSTSRSQMFAVSREGTISGNYGARNSYLGSSDSPSQDASNRSTEYLNYVIGSIAVIAALLSVLLISVKRRKRNLLTQEKKTV